MSVVTGQGLEITPVITMGIRNSDSFSIIVNDGSDMREGLRMIGQKWNHPEAGRLAAVILLSAALAAGMTGCGSRSGAGTSGSEETSDAAESTGTEQSGDDGTDSGETAGSTESDEAGTDGTEAGSTEADAGETAEEADTSEEEVTHTYSESELVEMVTDYDSMQEDVPDYYQTSVTDDGLLLVELLDDGGSSVSYEVDQDTSDGHDTADDSETIHFADYAPDQFLLSDLGYDAYTADDFKQSISDSGFSGKDASDYLNMLINELYARHGRKFKNEDIQAFFNDCPWYSGTVDSGEIDGNEQKWFNTCEYDNWQVLTQLRNTYQ